MKVRALAGVDAFASACSRKAVMQPRHLVTYSARAWGTEQSGGCGGDAGIASQGAPRGV